MFNNHIIIPQKRVFDPVFLCIFIFLFNLNSYASGQTQDSETKVDEILQSLSLKQKIGQLFIFGFSGTNINKDIQERIKKQHIGSLILFKRNIKSPKQTYQLTKQMQDYTKQNKNLPLFLMVDQEGGVVSRIKTSPPPPSALSLGGSDNLEVTRTTGRVTGEVLKHLGFNFNLAPVADLSNPRKRNFIGSRSFGEDPDKVFNFAFAFSEGLLESGVLPTYKHFPGHGNLLQDSHKTMPSKDISESNLISADALPFKKLAESNTPSAIMSAHISFPNIDPTGEPATYSKVLLTDLLKNKFKFQGLVMTDDLEMHGAKADLTVGQRAVKAFNAGADLLMIAWTHKEQIKAYNYMLLKAREGDISTERINASLRKIIKYKLLVSSPERPYDKSFLRDKLAELKNLSTHVSFLNFKKNFNLNADNVDINSFNRVYIYSSYGSFYKNVKSHINLKTRFFRLKKGNTLTFKRLEKSRKTLGVFHVSGSGTARILNKLPKNLKSKIIVINSTYPGAILRPEEFLGYSHTNTKNNKAAYWLIKRLKKKNHIVKPKPVL